MFSSKTIRCLKLEGLIAVCSLLLYYTRYHSNTNFPKQLPNWLKSLEILPKFWEKSHCITGPFLTYKLGDILVPRASRLPALPLRQRRQPRSPGNEDGWGHPRPQAQARAALMGWGANATSFPGSFLLLHKRKEPGNEVGANAPLVPPPPPPRNHILPPQEKSLFPKIIQTNQRRITNR